MISELFLQFQMHLRCEQNCFVATKRTFYWCAVMCVLISTIAHADEEVNGKVTAVLDGNTIEISCFCETTDVRTVSLVGIDSPEMVRSLERKQESFWRK